MYNIPSTLTASTKAFRTNVRGVTGAVLTASLLLGLVGCGSGDSSSSTPSTPSTPSATAGSLAGTYAVSFAAAPIAAAAIHVPFTNGWFKGPMSGAVKTGTESLDFTINLVDDKVQGQYTGTYTDGSGLMESVSGTKDSLKITFTDSKSTFDDSFSRTGTITLANVSVDDKRNLLATIDFKFDDKVGTAITPRSSKGPCGGSRKSTDDSSSSSSSSGGASSSGVSDDAARVPGTWGVRCASNQSIDQSTLVLNADKSVSTKSKTATSVTLVPNSRWTFTAGEPEKLDIVLPGIGTYNLNDVRRSGTVAAGNFTPASSTTKTSVQLTKQ